MTDPSAPATQSTDKLRTVLDYVPCEVCLTIPAPEPQDHFCSICARLNRTIVERVVVMGEARPEPAPMAAAPEPEPEAELEPEPEPVWRTEEPAEPAAASPGPWPTTLRLSELAAEAPDEPSPPPFTLVAPAAGRLSGAWVLAHDEPPPETDAWAAPAVTAEPAWPSDADDERLLDEAAWPGAEPGIESPPDEPAWPEAEPPPELDEPEVPEIEIPEWEPEPEPAWTQPEPEGPERALEEFDFDAAPPAPQEEDELDFEEVEFEAVEAAPEASAADDLAEEPELSFEALPAEPPEAPAPGPAGEMLRPPAADEWGSPEAPYRHGDYTLYAKDVDTPTGMRTIHFFAKRAPEDAQPSVLPEGFAVEVNAETGLPYLRRTDA